jgi:hypothetical protein
MLAVVMLAFCAGANAFAMTATIPAVSASQASLQKLPWQPNGYSKWTYRPESGDLQGQQFEVSYVQAGDGKMTYLEMCLLYLSAHARLQHLVCDTSVNGLSFRVNGTRLCSDCSALLKQRQLHVRYI